MKIYVLVKHVPDTAATITVKENNEIDDSIVFLMNPYDENAVEAAVQLSENQKGCEVIAVTLGNIDAEKTLRSAMSMGIDRSIHILENGYVDPVLSAHYIHKAIQIDCGEHKNPDLILGGKCSVDSESCQTLFHLSECFHIPCLSNIVNIEHCGDSLIVEKEGDSGEKTVFEVPFPCILGAAKSLNSPRYPKFPDIMKAKKKNIQKMRSEDISIAVQNASFRLLSMKPALDNRKAVIMDDSDASLDKLIDLLKKDKLIE